VRALREAAGTGDESIFDRMRLRYGLDMVTKNTISSIDKFPNLVYIQKVGEMTSERIACANKHPHAQGARLAPRFDRRLAGRIS
jgi:hypothetical protein